MGQIIGRTAKPDACNLRSLSSFGTPAAGQHILVSTDNSAMQNGQGNFDAYVVGDGTTPAIKLPFHVLHFVDGEIESQGSFQRTGNGWIAYSNGELQASANMEYFSIPNDGYTRIRAFLSSGDANSAAVAFYTSETIGKGNYLQDKSVVLTAGTNTLYDVNVPSEAKLIVITNRSAIRNASFSLYKASRAYLLGSDLTENISDGEKKPVTGNAVYSDIYKEQTYLPFSRVDGANTKGSINTFTSKKIPVSAGDIVKWVYSADQSTGVQLRFEDSAGNIIGDTYLSTNGSGGSRTITAPASSAYIVATFVNTTGYTPSVYINGLLAWYKKEASIDERLKKVENSVGSIVTQNDVLSSSGYIGYASKIWYSSANMECFCIKNNGYSKVKAVLNSIDTGAAAIAFYSTEYVSADGFMSESVQFRVGTGLTYESVVPSNAKLIVISNRVAIGGASFSVTAEPALLLSKGDVKQIIDNSENPISSKAVSSAVSDRSNFIPCCNVSGNNGTRYYTQGWFVCDRVPVSAGDSVRWIFNSDMSKACFLQVLDSDGNTIGNPYYGANGANGERTITAPANAAFIYASFADNAGYTPSIYINGTLVWSRVFGINDRLNRSVTPKFFQENTCIKVIAHRGWLTTEPENTMPAFREAARNGIKYIETDIQFTSDNVPVLLHDATIDRTSNGTGNVNDFTYNELLSYDFGSWFSSEFAGTKIPTLDEFMAFCRATGSHPYLELKSNVVWTSELVAIVDNIVHSYGMRGKVTYISGGTGYLALISALDTRARLGCVVSSVTESVITAMSNLKTEHNEVFIDSLSATSDEVEMCKEANIPLEVWNIQNSVQAKDINHYVSGMTCNGYIPSFDYYVEEMF